MSRKVQIAIAAALALGVAGTSVAAPPSTSSSGGGITQETVGLNTQIHSTTVHLPISSSYGQRPQGGDNAIEDGLARDFSNTASEVGNSVTSQIENCINPSNLANELVDGVVNRYTGGKGFGGDMTAGNYSTSVGLDNFNPKSPAWDSTTKPVTLPSPPGSQVNVNTDLPTQTVQIPVRTPVQPRRPTVGSSVYGGSGV